MKNNYDVFISYSHKDRVFVQKLATALSKHGLKSFIDEQDIEWGSSLVESLTNAIQEARFVLVIMSPNYFSSQWANKELDMALSREFEEGEIKVIPILYKDCEIPPLLQSKLYADFRAEDGFRNSLPSLISVLTEKPLAIKKDEEQKGKFKETAIGDISPDINANELKKMVNELQAKVDTFIEGTEQPSKEELLKENRSIDPKLCFIVMPFSSEELNDVYEYFIKPSIEKECALRCERGDDLFGSNVIMEDIRKSIEKSRLIVADLTDRNPNVFYEVGIAHTLKKDVLLLSQTIGDVPFDLRHMRVLLYKYTPKGCKKLEKRIVEHVNAIIENT